MRTDLDVDIIRLRAWWDQVQAMLREAEAEGGLLVGCRMMLAEARVLIDYAEELNAAP